MAGGDTHTRHRRTNREPRSTPAPNGRRLHRPADRHERVRADGTGDHDRQDAPDDRPAPCSRRPAVEHDRGARRLGCGRVGCVRRPRRRACAGAPPPWCRLRRDHTPRPRPHDTAPPRPRPRRRCPGLRRPRIGGRRRGHTSPAPGGRPRGRSGRRRRRRPCRSAGARHTRGGRGRTPARPPETPRERVPGGVDERDRCRGAGRPPAGAGGERHRDGGPARGTVRPHRPTAPPAPDGRRSDTDDVRSGRRDGGGDRTPPDGGGRRGDRATERDEPRVDHERHLDGRRSRRGGSPTRRPADDGRPTGPGVVRRDRRRRDRVGCDGGRPHTTPCREPHACHGSRSRARRGAGRGRGRPALPCRHHPDGSGSSGG